MESVVKESEEFKGLIKAVKLLVYELGGRVVPHQ